ncbi:MAG: hypothetical protein ACRERV_17140, partial [Methylococcales bacterium]
YMDEPTKHYSSGMIVRLGFAIIAAVRPPLLITDEVLGVGDESFQKKCSRWIDDYVNSGGTLLLVSHSVYHVQKLCREAIWLHHGRIEMQGDVYNVTQSYLAWHESKQIKNPVSKPLIDGDYEYGIESIEVNGCRFDDIVVHESGRNFSIKTVLTSRDESAPVLLCGWVRADGTSVFGVSSEMDNIAAKRTGDGRFEFQLHFPQLALLPGKYQLRVHSMDSQGLRLFQTVSQEVNIVGESRAFGLVALPHHWD